MVAWLYVASYLCLHNMALGKITITQDPNILNVSNGDTAKISCQWNSEDDQQVRVQWRKQKISNGEENGTLLCAVLKTEPGNSSKGRNNTRTCNVANNNAQLTIDGVTEEDAGIYVCEVIIEIPVLVKAKGNGTQLHVQCVNRDTRYLYLTILLIIPILTSVCCFYCRRRKKEKELFLDHIYGNVKRNTTRPSKDITCKMDTKKTSV